MDADPHPRYHRVLLKLSGEILAGAQSFGIETKAFDFICKELKEIYQLGIQTAVVIGGGNIFRGLNAAQNGVDRVIADNMGMLATVINALALKDKLESSGIPARVLSAIKIGPFVEQFNRDSAIVYLEANQVVILAAGTGQPFFSTDTAASLRAAELNVDIILKGTKVDGVYSDDPQENPDAQYYSELGFIDVLDKGLKVMDLTSITMCRENNIPICVFNLHKPGNLKKIVMGGKIGTIIS